MNNQSLNPKFLGMILIVVGVIFGASGLSYPVSDAIESVMNGPIHIPRIWQVRLGLVGIISGFALRFCGDDLPKRLTFLIAGTAASIALATGGVVHNLLLEQPREFSLLKTFWAGLALAVVFGCLTASESQRYLKNQGQVLVEGDDRSEYKNA